MKLLNITDLHGNVSHLAAIENELESADLIVIGGDITNFGGRSDAERILDTIAAINPNILAVSGNCDRAGVEECLSDRGIDLHAKARRKGAFAFVGLSGSLPGPGPTPNTSSEEELAATLAGVRLEDSKGLVFVSHQPPFDTVADIVSHGRHVGSRSVRRFIEQTRPLLCLTGHIHESVGHGDLGGCRIVNPGSFVEGRYALIDIDDAGKVLVELRGE